MSFIGGVLGGVAGFLTGGPAGAFAGAAAGLSRGGLRGLPLIGPRPMPFGPVGPGIFTMPQPMGQMCPPGTRCAGISTDGFCMGSCVQMDMPAGMMPMMARAGACPLPAPRGFHWNRRTYCTLRQGTVPACTKLIKNRHINVANGRAAKRAVRRIVGTHRLLQRIDKSLRRIKGVKGARVSRGSHGRGCRCPGCAPRVAVT